MAKKKKSHKKPQNKAQNRAQSTPTTESGKAFAQPSKSTSNKSMLVRIVALTLVALLVLSVVIVALGQ